MSQSKNGIFDKIRDILNKIYNLEIKIKSNSDVKHNLLIKN